MKVLGLRLFTFTNEKVYRCVFVKSDVTVSYFLSSTETGTVGFPLGVNKSEDVYGRVEDHPNSLEKERLSIMELQGLYSRRKRKDSILGLRRGAVISLHSLVRLHRLKRTVEHLLCVFLQNSHFDKF